MITVNNERYNRRDAFEEIRARGNAESDKGKERKAREDRPRSPGPRCGLEGRK